MVSSKLGRGLALAVLLAAAACATEDVDPRPATLSYISKAILRPSCATASCHSEHIAINGIDLHDAESAYRSFTEGDVDWVRPEAPARAELLSLLRGEQQVTRMPPDQPLPEADILLIERWILEGAPNN